MAAKIMKYLSMFLLIFIPTLSANAQVIFGPIPPNTQCPGPGRGQTQRNAKYCFFDDPKIVQVLNAPCPAGLRGASNSSIGNQKWCV